MNQALVDYLAKEKENYERGLVNKADVEMWLGSYSVTVKDIEEAQKEIESW